MFSDPWGLCKDERGNERQCVVKWATGSTNLDKGAQQAVMDVAQRIADKADVDLQISSARRNGSCSDSRHNCGQALDFNVIGNQDVGTLLPSGVGQARSEAMPSVQRVQDAASQIPAVYENFGPAGLFKRDPGPGMRSLDRTANAGLWNAHQDHVHISIRNGMSLFGRLANALH